MVFKRAGNDGADDAARVKAGAAKNAKKPRDDDEMDAERCALLGGGQQKGALCLFPAGFSF